MSAMMRMAWCFSSKLMTGSVLTSASILPLRKASTAAADVPTPMKDTSSARMPALARTSLATIWVEEPGALIPIFLPRRSLGER
ncbi:hypothetical protein D3C80_1866240 [compost metagenome]